MEDSKILKYLEENFINDLSFEVGVKVLDLIQEEFNNAQDPYGTSWKPNKKGTQTLVDTGEMRESFILDVKDDGFSISNDTDYAIYHQTGTNKMPQRKILPDNNTLPEKWLETITNTIDSLIKKNNE